MAVRFSADGQDYTRAIGLGAQTAFTVCCWVNVVDRNDYSTIWSLDNGTGDMELLQTDADGTTLMFYPDYNAGNVLALTPGVWTFIAIVGATTGNARTAYYRTASQGSLTTVTLGSATSTNMATLRIGESAFGAEWWNGSIAAAKPWIGVTLTHAEIAAESCQYAPARTANLTAYYPMSRPDPMDYSGNGQSLGGGSGVGYSDGPPIPLQRIRVRQWLASAPAGGGIAEQGTATVGLSATATAVKVATVSGVCSMGMAASSALAKRAAPAGRATVGVAGTGSAKKVAPALGRATTGLAATGRAAKKTTQAGAATVGLSATRAEVTARAQGGTAALGVSATGVAAKRAPARGTATLGLSSTRSGVIVRAVTGICSLGLGSSSAPRKTAVAGGLAALGPAGTVLQRKRAVAAGSCSVGVAPRGAAVKRAVLGGRATVGGGHVSTPTKTARGRGTATLGVASTHLSVVLPVPVLTTGGQVRTVWVSDDPPVSVWRAGRTVQSTWRVDP
jgi:hypothetical protein